MPLWNVGIEPMTTSSPLCNLAKLEYFLGQHIASYTIYVRGGGGVSVILHLLMYYKQRHRRQKTQFLFQEGFGHLHPVIQLEDQQCLGIPVMELENRNI